MYNTLSKHTSLNRAVGQGVLQKADLPSTIKKISSASSECYWKFLVTVTKMTSDFHYWPQHSVSACLKDFIRAFVWQPFYGHCRPTGWQKLKRSHYKIQRNKKLCTIHNTNTFMTFYLLLYNRKCFRNTDKILWCLYKCDHILHC